MLKRFVCMFLSAMMVVMIAVAGVSADDAEKLTFNENGVAQVAVDKNGLYSFKLDKPAFVYARAGSAMLSMSTPEGIPIIGLKTVEMYMDAGEYEIEVQGGSADTTLTIMLFYVDIYYTVDGKEYKVTPDSVFFFDKEKKATLEVRPASGTNYDTRWTSYYQGRSISSKEKKINVEEEGDFTCFIKGEYTYPFDVSVVDDIHLQFVGGYMGNYLLDPGSSITLTGEATCDLGTPGHTIWYDDPEQTLTLTDFNWPEYIHVIAGYEGGYGIHKYDCLFLKDPAKMKGIETGKKVSLSLKPMIASHSTGDTVEDYQAIFKFAPDKTDTYTISSYGSADTYVALFDSKNNCIGFDDDKSGNFWENNIRANMSYKGDPGDDDRNFELKADLKAGETYYYAIFVINQEMNSAGKRYDFEVELTGKTAPTSAPTETPVSNPTNTPEQGSELSFDDFVERLYVVALGRQSEPEGKAFWCKHVGNGDLTGAACANEFLLSKEFNDRKLSDEEFLKVLYKTFFDRDAEKDPDGFNFWMNSLKTEGRDKVVDGFINSTEWCNICASYGVRSGATRAKATIASANAKAFATRLYTKCLGREPEEEGLKFWSLGLTNQELSGTQAAKEFFYSPEFVNAKYSNEEYINRMYETFMGREPEAEGKAYWLGLLNKGTSRDEVFDFFSTCPEFTEICKEYAIQR